MQKMLRSGREFGNEFRYRDPASGRLEGAYIPIDFAANAESLGAKTVISPMPIPGIGSMAMFTDPEGHLVGVVSG